MSIQVKAQIFNNNQWQELAVYNTAGIDERIDEQLNSGMLETINSQATPYPPYSMLRGELVNYYLYYFPQFEINNTIFINGNTTKSESVEYTIISGNYNVEDEVYSNQFVSMATNVGKTETVHVVYKVTIRDTVLILTTTAQYYGIYGENFEGTALTPTWFYQKRGSKPFEGYAFDSVTKRGNNYYKHSISFYEPTKRLEGYLTDGLCVTQPIGEGATKTTMWDVLVRICLTTPLRIEGQAQTFYPDTTLQTQLSRIIAPEFRWVSRLTLWEVLKEYGAVFDAIPRLTYSSQHNDFCLITFDEINELKALVDTAYASVNTAVQDSDFCSEIETATKNLITESKNGTTYYPTQNTYMGLRPLGDMLTDTDANIILPSNIYKIQKIYVDITKANSATAISGASYDDDGNPVTANNLAVALGVNELDISSRIFTKDAYDALPNMRTRGARDWQVGYEDMTTLYKENCGYWENNVIVLNSHSAQEFAAIIPTMYQNLKGLLTGALSDYLKKLGVLESNLQASFEYAPHLAALDYDKLYFRVEYIPYHEEVRISASKLDKQPLSFVQNYNALADVTDAEAYGRNMFTTVQKMGVNERSILAYYNYVEDIPPLGSQYEADGDLYVLVANEITVESSVRIKVIHTYSKDWTMLSQYVGIDRKYRDTPIPAEYNLRQLKYEDYCVISNKVEPTRDAILCEQNFEWKMLETHGVMDIKNMYLFHTKTDDNYEGVAIPVNYGCNANSFWMYGTTTDNLSAGRQLINIEGDKAFLSKDVFYTKEDGTADKLYIGLSDDTPNDNELNKALFPYVNTAQFVNAPSLFLMPMLKGFEVKKDVAEQLSFIYQRHYVSPLSSIIIGDALAKNYYRGRNPLNEIRLLGIIAGKLPRQANTVVKNYNELGNLAEHASIEYCTYVDREPINYDNYFILKINSDMQYYAGWAIVDENNNILIACNDSNITQLYFNFCHTYHGR